MQLDGRFRRRGCNTAVLHYRRKKKKKKKKKKLGEYNKVDNDKDNKRGTQKDEVKGKMKSHRVEYNGTHVEEDHDAAIEKDIFDFKKNFNSFDTVDKYDIFEYIIVILNIYDKIHHDRERISYKPIHRINIASFEYFK
ncbi:AP-3 complex subunit delta, putative [Plasmodium malariae]|uniref:AP-3 complex subunit delta, putative n=1 Tax=Plasmodium malariae TaxID=5858 RepID=A0A1A8WPW0_PLAMA|nr:AP-3 complex subunit delta, putative [Plasmodium malariae]